MAEPSQEILNSIESDETPSNKRSKRKKFSSKRSQPDKQTEVSKSRPALLCDSWRIPNKQRIQIGFVGLAFIVPFIALSLIYPEWTGHIGTRLSLGLFSFLGQGALLVPIATLYIVLSCAGFRLLKATRYVYLLPVLICSVLTIQRWSQTGGWLGRLMDKALVASLGPGGAWLMTGTLLTLSAMAFFPRAKKEVAHGFSFLGEVFTDSRLRLRNWWLKLREPSEEGPSSIEIPIPTKRDVTTQNYSEPKAVVDNTAENLVFLPTEDSVAQPVSQNRPPTPSPADFSENRPETITPKIESPERSRVETPVRDPEPTVVDSRAPAAIPAPPEAPKLNAPEPLSQNENGNIVRFADPTEIEDSLELEKPNLTKSDEAQAAVPRARNFELPPLVLLDELPYAARSVPTEDKSQALLDALDSFGVKAKLLQIVRGPAVTRYELQPARGVKVSKFTSLTNDIALALASTAIRIEAPIPGKSAIGIEIPNKHTDLVVLKDIIRDSIFTESKGLTVALGKDLSGRPVVTDLQKMPHLLVAGTTGSGKSVCVNGLIVSLLYRFTPDQLQLMMVDPKQVELSVYEDIPHLVGFSDNEKGEIIVDPKKAAQALHQVVGLMEERYSLFAENKVRNLAEYNKKFEDEALPWFVVIIDELADLMMVASKSVETSICRIAQKARAAGIHLVLATQRPSADVITGLIKVNIPSRAAFAVSSQVDSRVILDSGGAEHLLGKGDMLFLPVDASDPKRIQGSYVGNEEISRIVEFWKGQGLPDNRIEFELQEDILATEDNADDGNSDDALIQEALRVTLNRKQASASMLQTELKVGYARARRLLIAMEKKGWVGPPEGSKPRKILYTGPPASDPAE